MHVPDGCFHGVWLYGLLSLFPRYGFHDVGMHGFGHLLGVGHGFHHGLCAVERIAGGKHAGAAGTAVFIRNQQTAGAGIQAAGGAGDGILRALSSN